MPGSADPGWPPVLAETIRRWARRRRRQQATRVLAMSLGASGLLCGAAMAGDLAGDPLPWLRVGLAGAGLLVALAGGLLALRRLAAPWSHVEAARELERAAGLPAEPLSGPLLLTLHPLAGHSRWMTGRALALAAVAADGLDLRQLLPWRALAMPAAAATGILALLLSAGIAEPAARAALVRALLPWRELPAPGDEPLVAEPGDTWLAPGGRLDLAVSGQVAALTAELVWSDGRHEELALLRDGALQRLAVGPLHRDLRWRVRGPGLASSWRTATVVAVPRLAALSMQLSPPGYAGLPDERVQGGDASVLAGSDIAIDAVFEGPIAATAAVVADGAEVALPLSRSPYGGQFGSVRLRLSADLSWHLRLIVAGGPGGVVVDLPQRWRLRAIADTPPQASATPDAAVVAPGRAVRITATAADDVALASVWLELAGEGGGEPVRLALPVPAGARRLEATAVVVPADLGARPGDRLVVVPVARDRAGGETRGTPVPIAVAQPVHAARHDLAARLDELITLAQAAAAAASEAEKAWRAAARAWREEDPAAGAASLRAAAARVRNLATAATAVSDGAEAAAVLANAPGNLETLSMRALTVAGGALALAARSSEAEAGAKTAVSGAAEAATALVAGADGLVASAGLAAAASVAAAVTADLETARDQLAGAAAVLAAERAWTTAQWQPGLLGRFWRGNAPDAGEPAARAAEVPAVADRDVPGLGREGWCARWSGEILLPVAGRWTFRCTADDGVRLRVAGRDLLPEGSWRNQGATPYVGSIELPAGWHALALDYFQTSGPSVLRFEAGTGEPAAVPLQLLRHRRPPEANARQAMAALPAGAGEAATLRARQAVELAAAAAAALAGAVERLPDSRVQDGLTRRAEQAVAALSPLRGILDWSDVQAVGTAGQAAATATAHAAELARVLWEACRAEGRAGGSAPEDRLREAAAKPGGGQALRIAGELAKERAALAALAADSLSDPAQRAAALAAAWALDDAAAALAGSDADAARAAVAAATPPRALAARHARAAEAAAGVAAKGGALLVELAVSPGWPPGLLRPARDLLRRTAATLRAGGDIDPAARLAAECARAAELEALRPGAPPSEALTTAAAWLRDQTVLPQADALAEIADLLEQVDRSVPHKRPEARMLAAAAEARRAAAAAALADSASGLGTAAPALAAAGLSELAARATSLSGLARTLAAAPDRTLALNLSEALAGTLAEPVAAALADGRIDPGSPAAQAGRLAAQTAAAAISLANIAVPASPPEDEAANWSRSDDPAAREAASAAAAVDFPEEHRAAIRAYLRRIGAPR